MRKLAREYTFQLIFEYLFLKEYNEETLLGFLEDANLSEEDRTYVREVYENVTSRYGEIFGRLEGALSNYRAERLFKPDLAVLILACYEIFERADVPDAAAVNEAVELCKRYGTEKSPAFVNGVLADLIRNKNATAAEEN